MRIARRLKLSAQRGRLHLFAGEEPVGSGWSMALPAKLAKPGYADSTRYWAGSSSGTNSGVGDSILYCSGTCLPKSSRTIAARTRSSDDESALSTRGVESRFRRRALLRTTLLLGQPV